ncbi:PilW family protein [Thermodesulfobacterium commune]|uniref:Prepilin-type N-terminal cleavage/methylation domain-containing protein n=1 Tax=Thermodesulfobacterium commune DSM 2178 TaxID=289377 RepID=A0A075WV04_9BACT|nr:prepilin-type N-terminal cleavage/methylation domain-containing protein [Thermodesulfobacterium commune]AIH04731.1 hypothetical protein HL41_08790 [Thermodesulfobacterium commune DSM 2178]
MQLSINQKKDKGYSLLELLIATFIGLLVIAAIYGFYWVAQNTFTQIRHVTSVKEQTKVGLAQLEWFFQRWGFGVPCSNYNNPTSCIQLFVDNNTTSKHPYPPPSSLYLRISQDNPCDEVWFYGSLGGQGFVTRVVGVNKVAVMSCRLNIQNTQNNRENCYHVWRRRTHFVNKNANSNGSLCYDTNIFNITTTEYPIIFKLSGLSSNNLDCSRENNPDNAELDIRIEAYEGSWEDYNGTQQIFVNATNLEGGDLIIRTPHLVHFFCRQNEHDQNNLWLYVETKDVALNCKTNENPMPLVRVNSFKVTPQNNGVLVRIEVIGTETRFGINNSKIIMVERFFGR